MSPLRGLGRSAAILLVLLVGVACEPRQPTPLPPTATPFGATPPPPATFTPAQLEHYQRIEERVSQERGLSSPAVNVRQLVLRASLRERFQREIDEEDRRELRVAQELYRFLGLIGEQDDLEARLLDLEEDQVVGFYDLNTGELTLVSEAASYAELEEFTYAHEFTHALQQGNFNIRALQGKVRGQDEPSTALTALIEGDASLAAARYGQKYIEMRKVYEQGGKLAAKSRPAPPFLQDGLNFPYVQGVAFVQGLQAGGWAAVDAAYRDPPTTTEQIMHPDKYAVREGAITVELPELLSALPTGWELADSDVVGESQWKSLLDLQLGTSEALQAAAGWGGDQFAFLTGPDGARLFVASVVWDSAEDARQFFTSYGNYLAKLGARLEKNSTNVSGSLKGRQESLTLRGQTTVLVVASDAGLVGPVLGRFA